MDWMVEHWLGVSIIAMGIVVYLEILALIRTDRELSFERNYTVMNRGVGYCENVECEDYAKGVFLLNHGDTFYCPRCRALGYAESEKGKQLGKADFFSEVRVGFDFHPIEKRYQSTAIVRDESTCAGNVYLLQSPLIKTENRALKVAESILSTLNVRGVIMGEIPRLHETLLSFDVPLAEFSDHCQKLHEQWENSSLTKPSTEA